MSGDTHEKVLADLHDAIGKVVDHAFRCDPSETSAFFWTPEDFDVFLDRQAEITRKECAEKWGIETKWISTGEAAEILGVSRIRVNQLIKEGQLVAERVGNRYSIDKASVEDRAANPPGPGRPW